MKCSELQKINALLFLHVASPSPNPRTQAIMPSKHPNHCMLAVHKHPKTPVMRKDGRQSTPFPLCSVSQLSDRSLVTIPRHPLMSHCRAAPLPGCTSPLYISRSPRTPCRISSQLSRCIAGMQCLSQCVCLSSCSARWPRLL